MTTATLQHGWSIPTPGETIAGKYLIDGYCGRGGIAMVLSATHTALGQRVAIKVLLPEWAEDPEVRERFAREGLTATRIKSEHAVRVLDIDTLDTGQPYLVLEYLVGHDLEKIVARWGPPPVRTAIEWVLQATEAIAEAHAQGIVHRDLKPANLFLTTDADGCAYIKVIDFGLSKLTDPHGYGSSGKLTRPTDVLGSPHYMAPEQLRAASDAGPLADLWALGAVLHELLSGQPPFRGDSMPEICASVLTQPPPPLRSVRPDVPAEVERAVLRCLEKDPGARFADAAELARALAPFGPEAAQMSLKRIEGALGSSKPSGEFRVRGAEPASARVALGSFLILTGIGIGGLVWAHSLVHAGEAPITAAIPTSAESVVARDSMPQPQPAATIVFAPAVPRSTASHASQTTLAPRAHAVSRARPYRIEPSPSKHSVIDSVDSNPYAEPGSTEAVETAPSAEVPSPADEPGGAPDDLFDSRK